MSKRALTLFALVSLGWGIPYFFIKIAVDEVTPAFIVFARTAIASLFLIPLAMRQGVLKPALKRWPWVVIFAIIEMMIAWWLLNDAETRVSSSLTGLMIAAVPLVATLIARIGGDTSVTQPQRLMGLACGLVGVALLLGLDVSGGHADLRSAIQLLIVAVCYAAAPAIAARKAADVPGLGLAAASIALVALVYAIPAFLQRPTSVSGQTLGSLLALGTISTAMTFVLFFELIKEIGPVRTTLVTFINPAVAVFLGVAVLGEPLTAGMFWGFPLVLAGSWLAGKPRQSVVKEVSARAD